MAVDIKDVEQVAQELQQKFDDFKAKNDKRVDAIEQEKGKLAGQVETLNGKLSELENLKSDLEKELLELKRPAGGAQNKLATEHKEAFVGFLRKGREDGLRDLERKALQVGMGEGYPDQCHHLAGNRADRRRHHPLHHHSLPPGDHC